MGDQIVGRMLKFLVEELRKEPFHYNFNVASFSSLAPVALNKVFHEVLSLIDPSYEEECKADPAFQGPTKLPLDRIMERLRVLRYWSNKDGASEVIRKNLESSHCETHWEIMTWLLLRKEELQQRARLAKFLVKVQIPEEVLLDEEISNTYEQYEAKIEEFVQVHKKQKEIHKRIDSRPVSELILDLGKIDHDIECLTRKVEAVKRKVNHYPNLEECLQDAKVLRKERDSRLHLRIQIAQEDNTLALLDRKQDILFHQLTEMKRLNVNENTPAAVLVRLEQDVELFRHIVESKLPADLAISKRKYLALKITETNPPVCSLDLDARRQQILETYQSVQELEQLLAQQQLDSEQSELKGLRSQAKQCAKTRTHLEYQCRLMQQELEDIDSLLDDKKSQHKDLCQEERATVRDHGKFKEYVRKMRSKASQYKEMKRELQRLQTEIGHLSVTKYIVNGELQESHLTLKKLEETIGIMGLSEIPQAVLASEDDATAFPSIDEEEGLSRLSDKLNLTKELTSKVKKRRDRWNKMMNAVSEKRGELAVLRGNLAKAEDKLNQTLGPLKKEIALVEKEVQDKSDKLVELQTNVTKIHAEIPVLKCSLDRAKADERVKDDNGKLPVKSYSSIDRVRGKLVESERMKLCLEREIRQIQENEQFELNQQETWRDVHELLLFKLQDVKENRPQGTAASGGENMDFSKTLNFWENRATSTAIN